MTCKDCMYYKKEAAPFPAGRCYGYLSEGRKLVKATDYCSRGKEGTFEEYLEMQKRSWEHIMTDLLEGGIEMKLTRTPITTEDVRRWTNDFIKSKELIKSNEHLDDDRKGFLIARMNDALFLVAFVESQLQISCEDEVYHRARELQKKTYKEVSKEESED